MLECFVFAVVIFQQKNWYQMSVLNISGAQTNLICRIDGYTHNKILILNINDLMNKNCGVGIEQKKHALNTEICLGMLLIRI